MSFFGLSTGVNSYIDQGLSYIPATQVYNVVNPPKKPQPSALTPTPSTALPLSSAITTPFSSILGGSGGGLIIHYKQ